MVPSYRFGRRNARRAGETRQVCVLFVSIFILDGVYHSTKKDTYRHSGFLSYLGHGSETVGPIKETGDIVEAFVLC
jgi:hypothetical protein